jgi:hypothetical protein
LSLTTVPLTAIHMKSLSIAAALLALSSVALAYEVQVYSLQNCGGELWRNEKKTFLEDPATVPYHMLPLSMNVKLAESDGAVRVLSQTPSPCLTCGAGSAPCSGMVASSPNTPWTTRYTPVTMNGTASIPIPAPSESFDSGPSSSELGRPYLRSYTIK